MNRPDLTERQLEWLRLNVPAFKPAEAQARAARKHAEEVRKEMEGVSCRST